MRQLTIREARNKLDDMYPVDETANDENIEDILEQLKLWTEFSSKLEDIEIKFGILQRSNAVFAIEQAIYYVETELESNDISDKRVLQSALDSYKSDLGEQEKELDNLLDTIFVEDDFFTWR